MTNLKSQISNLKFALALLCAFALIPARADDGALNLLVTEKILAGSPATNLNAQAPWTNGPFPTNLLPGALPALSQSNALVLTNLNAQGPWANSPFPTNLLPGALPALSQSNALVLTNLNAQASWANGPFPTNLLPGALPALSQSNALVLTNLFMAAAGSVETAGNPIDNLSGGNCFWAMWPNSGDPQPIVTLDESAAAACTFTELTATYGYGTAIGAGTNIIAALLTNGVFAAGITNTGPMNGTSVYGVTQPINVTVTNRTLVCFKIWNTSSGNIGSTSYNVSLFTGR